MTLSSDVDVARLLMALGEQFAAARIRHELVVIGGSALLATGLTRRATRDVDLVSLLDGGELIDPRPLPEQLVAACNRVASDFGLPADWLNAAPAGLLDFGLPDGFVERLDRRDFGPALTAWFASRFDQIHFKLYAVADQGPGKHEADLRRLAPSPEELLAAARWTRTHDPSDGFRQELRAALAHFGVDDADLGT